MLARERLESGLGPRSGQRGFWFGPFQGSSTVWAQQVGLSLYADNLHAHTAHVLAAANRSCRVGRIVLVLNAGLRAECGVLPMTVV